MAERRARGLGASGLDVQPLRLATYQVAKCDLTLSLQVSGERIVGGVGYATALFERGTAERYAGYLRRLLEGMVGDDAQLVDELPILSAEERAELVYGWNETKAEFPGENACMSCSKNRPRTPGATAVVFEERS